MFVVSLRLGSCRTGRVMNSDSLRFEGETPQPDLDGLECRQIWQSTGANRMRQHNEWLVGKKTVAPSLRHSLSPIRQLTLKRTGYGPCNTNKGLCVGKGFACEAFPRHDMQIGNPIAINWDFSGKRQRGLAASPVNRRGLFIISAHERNREMIFCRRNALSPWKIVTWLTESQLRDRYCFSIHDRLRLYKKECPDGTPISFSSCTLHCHGMANE